MNRKTLSAILMPAIPRTVWALGFVSLFMDLSSELVHSLLPVFLVSTLGASVMTVGIIEGVSEAATPIAKVFSGAISDYFRRQEAGFRDCPSSTSIQTVPCASGHQYAS